MAAIIDPHEMSSRQTLEPSEGVVLLSARRNGFTLTQFETDTGQLVWAWQRRNEPGPRFLTRRTALRWMNERLGRGPDDAA